jgi:hypothetical protein
VDYIDNHSSQNEHTKVLVNFMFTKGKEQVQATKPRRVTNLHEEESPTTDFSPEGSSRSDHELTIVDSCGAFLRKEPAGHVYRHVANLLIKQSPKLFYILRILSKL